jgi:hypothetical protein
MHACKTFPNWKSWHTVSCRQITLVGKWYSLCNQHVICLRARACEQILQPLSNATKLCLVVCCEMLCDVRGIKMHVTCANGLEKQWKVRISLTMRHVDWRQSEILLLPWSLLILFLQRGNPWRVHHLTKWLISCERNDVNFILICKANKYFVYEIKLKFFLFFSFVYEYNG